MMVKKIFSEVNKSKQFMSFTSPYENIFCRNTQNVIGRVAWLVVISKYFPGAKAVFKRLSWCADTMTAF